MTWKLSFLIGAPIIALIIIAVVVILLVLRPRIDGRFERNMLTGFTLGTAAFIIVPLFSGTAFPLKAEYLQWRPVDGTVQSIDKRLIGGDGGMSERYVVSIDGYDVPYSIDDTRAATLREGDDVSLMCTREWQWAAVDGYACRWNQ